MHLKYIGDTETELNIRLDNRRKDFQSQKLRRQAAMFYRHPFIF